MSRTSITIWAVIAAVGSAIVMAVLRLRRPPSDTDLGSVSEQWIVQHRAGPDPHL